MDRYFHEIGDDLEDSVQQRLLNSIEIGRASFLHKPSVVTGKPTDFFFVPVRPQGLMPPTSLALALPSASLALNLRETLLPLLLSSLFAVLLWTVAFRFLCNRLFRPYTSTADTLSRLAAGNYDLSVRLSEAGDGILQEQNVNFNTLMSHIESLVSEMRQRIGYLNSAAQTLNVFASDLGVAVQEIDRSTQGLDEIRKPAAALAVASFKMDLLAERITSLTAQVQIGMNQFHLCSQNFEPAALFASHYNGVINFLAWCRYPVFAAPRILKTFDCPLGRWLASPAAEPFKKYPAFPELVHAHEQLHELEASVLKRNTTEASEVQRHRWVAELENISREVESHLMELYSQSREN
jgi:hypothetical protein